MTRPIRGIHHVTAIAGDPRANVDFYVGVLGLRLVKRTVNFDDPGTYHLYYGDEEGRPGTIMTFFPWPGARRGSRGSGQATVTSFSIPRESIGFWRERLAHHRVLAEDPRVRFEEETIAFFDPDGLKLELVAHDCDSAGEPWAGDGIPGEHAVRGFHGVTLLVRDPEPTAELLGEIMGLETAGERSSRFRFVANGEGPGRSVDVVYDREASFGRIAAGSVHHVAWRVPDDEAQIDWREKLENAGFHPTRVLDRQYFKSIYFREPGGVLFEFATDQPGFTFDESVGELGSTLKLPPWLERDRQRIEGALPVLDAASGGDGGGSS
jgi:glyoxalase family protein